MSGYGVDNKLRMILFILYHDINYIWCHIMIDESNHERKVNILGSFSDINSTKEIAC